MEELKSRDKVKIKVCFINMLQKSLRNERYNTNTSQCNTDNLLQIKIAVCEYEVLCNLSL